MLARLRLALLLVTSLVLGMCQVSSADDKDPASLLPDSTVLYVTFSDPGLALDAVLKPELVAKLNSVQEVTKFYESDGYRKFREAVKLFEDRLGVKWQEGLRDLVGGGVTFAHDPRSKANLLIIKAKKPELLTKFNDVAIEVIEAEVAKKGGTSPVKSAEHNGVKGWAFGKEEAHAIVGDMLIVTNKSDALKAALDLRTTGSSGSLASSKDFQAARKIAEPGAMAWGVANLDALRMLPPVSKVLSAKSDNPIAELILGGVIDVAARSPFVTFGIYPSASHAQLRIRMPDEDGKVAESRKWHFPKAGEGAPKPLRPKGLVATLTAYRDLSGMWMAREQLFNENVNSGFTKAETNLGLYFQGKDFGSEVLSQLAPRWQIVVARQEFPSTEPVPALRLPAFALVLEMKDQSLAQSLQLTYQNIVGIINISGLQSGKPQLIITGEEVEGITVSKVKRVVPADAEKENAPIEYNFGPACARVGKHFILGSTGDLVRDLAVQLKKNTEAATANSASDTTVLAINGAELLALFKENRQRIISQNMLSEGKSRDEAETNIGRLFELANLLKDLTLRFSTGEKAMTVELDVEVGSP